MERPRVVIIGAGFGGLACAKKLANRPVEVTVVDANNYHLFTPLLYQVASSLLNPGDIAQPVRSILRAPNIRFRQERVEGVDLAGKTLATADGHEIPYDYIVFATGSTANFFGIASLEQRALGLKDLPEALELRNHILHSLEWSAAHPEDADDAWLTFVVVGGGPTGVEYAGALSELVRHVLPREYPELRERAVRVILLEARERVLPPFPAKLGEQARRDLIRKGVDVRTGASVRSYEGDTVTLSNGETITAKTVVWAAGVRPSTLAGTTSVARSASGRIVVDQYLRVLGHETAFAIGDIASVVQTNGREVPMLSAPAMQEGRCVAANILASIEGAELRAFRYRDKGSMATIGKNSAVASIGPLRLSGFAGWITWLVVHLYYIIGFRNRLAVLLSWAWNYVRSDRPVRIIARARERRALEGGAEELRPGKSR